MDHHSKDDSSDLKPKSEVAQEQDGGSAQHKSDEDVESQLEFVEIVKDEPGDSDLSLDCSDNEDESESEEDDSDVEIFKCDVCNYMTVRKSNLQQHMVRHSRAKPFTCTTCNFRTARSDSLKRHMHQHKPVEQDKSDQNSYEDVFLEFVKNQRSSQGGNPIVNLP